MSSATLPMAHREIGGHNYTCVKMPFTRARKLVFELKNEFGSTLVNLMASAVSDAENQDKTFAAVLVAIADTMLDVGECTRLMDEVMSTVTVGGESRHLGDQKAIDSHFGDVDGMSRYVEVFRWAMETQYRDFFGAPLSRLSTPAQQSTDTGPTKD